MDLNRCVHCGALKARRSFYLLRQDFETALRALGISEEKLRAKQDFSGRSLQRNARERHLVAYFLWTRGGHEKDIGELIGRERTVVLYAIDRIGKELKSSEALWWRSVLERLERAVTGAERTRSAA